MRDADLINNLWQRGGPFSGDEGKPHTRVTVQAPWPAADAAIKDGDEDHVIHPTTTKAGNAQSRGVPVRWYQKADNSQTETEVPNVKSVNIDRSIDTDVASCQITLNNKWTYGNGMVPAEHLTEGNRHLVGHFTPTRGAYPEGQVRWGQEANEWENVFVPNAIIRCVDTETEIFTRRGWLRWNEVEVGDETLGINPASGTGEWQTIRDVFREHHDGPMMHLRTRTHDSLTTLDHKWLIEQSNGGFEWSSTSGLVASSRIPMSVPPVALGQRTPYCDDFVELAAWYYTEGSAEHRKRSLDWGGVIYQSSNANPSLVERIRALMTRLYGPPGPLPRGKHIPQEVVDEAIFLCEQGVRVAQISLKLNVSEESVRRWKRGLRTGPKDNKWREVVPRPGDHHFRFTQEVGRKLREVVVGPDKVPTESFLCSLTPTQLNLFIDVCVLGDGTVDRGNRSFIQCNEERASAFEYACVLAGQPVHRKRHGDGWSIALLSQKVVRPVSAMQQGGRQIADAVVEYSDIVWCPSVEHGNWVARRNGSVYVTGNTYQGYGGTTKTRANAITDGNIILTGVWLIDEVRVSTTGELGIQCRDMAKLLVEQQLFPPLVPSTHYPLTYYRWVYENVAINAASRSVTSSVNIAAGGKRCVFVDSSVDRWYPGSLGSGGKLLHGHRGIDSLDGNLGSFWLGEGNAGPDRAFATSWIEYECGEYMNAVHVHPWAGNYTMYVSVMVAGQWQGGATVPYDPAELYATQTVVNTGANIPYVQQFGVPWETGSDYVLPQAYKADRVRITFRHLAYSGIGPWYYRAGVREFRILATANAGATTAATTTVGPFFWAADSLRNPANLNAIGYVTSSQFGQVDAFGDCRVLTQSGGNPATNATVYWIVLTSSGDGYWIMRGDGSVTSYGAARFYGSPKDLGIGLEGGADAAGERWAAICPTPTNLGYWCVAVDGRIRAFGDATNFATNIPGFSFGSNTYIAGASSLKNAQGLLMASTNGTVYVLGAATHYGNYTESANASLVAVVPTMSGNGYWLMTGGGGVQARGAAVDYGQSGSIIVTQPDQIFDQLMATPTNGGYYILRGIGNVNTFGDAINFGSPIPGSTGQIRKNGNYCVDETTEIFTKRGWLRHDQVKVGDQTLGINPAGGSEWQPISHLFREHRDDIDMVLMEGRDHSSLTTPDHRWLVDIRGEQRWATTQTLPVTSKIPIAAPRADLPLWPTHKDALVELVAWYWTEGSLDGTRGSLSQSVTVNPVQTERIDACLRSLYGEPGRIATAGHSAEVVERALTLCAQGSTCSAAAREVGVHVSTVTSWARSGGPKRGAKWRREIPRANGVVVFRLSSVIMDDLLIHVPGSDKVVTPEFLVSLTGAQLDLFIDTSIAADGCTRRDNGLRSLAQQHEGRASAFQFAVALSGSAFSASTSGSCVSTTVKTLQFTAPQRLGVSGSAHRHKVVEGRHYSGVIWCPTTTHHNWLARRRGTVYFTGNTDYSDIIKDLALFSGFLLYDPNIAGSAAPQVYGNIESTGSYSSEQLPDELFDKRPVIDAMTELKETVGYVMYIDDEGGLQFRSPNYWSYGNNILSTGQRISEIPEIDERVNLFDYSASRNDESLRSLIIISSEDPNDAGDTTITTKIIPQTAEGLRGLLKPAMWVNGLFQNADEQQIMAELISLHIWFAQRIGQVTCVANPALGIDDQVRIYERQTGEVFLHYVRGINTTHDLDSGTYTMTLTTHWLGTGEDWAVTDDAAFMGDEDHFVLSKQAAEWVQKQTQAITGGSFELGNASANPSYVGIDPSGPDGNPAAGSANP